MDICFSLWEQFVYFPFANNVSFVFPPLRRMLLSLACYVRSFHWCVVIYFPVMCFFSQPAFARGRSLPRQTKCFTYCNFCFLNSIHHSELSLSLPAPFRSGSRMCVCVCVWKMWRWLKHCKRWDVWFGCVYAAWHNIVLPPRVRRIARPKVQHFSILYDWLARTWVVCFYSAWRSFLIFSHHWVCLPVSYWIINRFHQRPYFPCLQWYLAVGRPRHLTKAIYSRN